MTITKNKQLEAIMQKWEKSYYYDLYDCYSNYSIYKTRAFKYCLDLMKKYKGSNGKIISYNTMAFSFGFIGEYEGKKAFFYITKDYDRVLILE